MLKYSRCSRYLTLVLFFLALAQNSAAQEVAVFPQLGHTNYVNSVAFSPDGRQVLSGSNDNTVKLWDVATGREILTFSGHTRPVSSVTFSPDGRQALSASYDTTAKLWDVTTGREIRNFKHIGVVQSVTFSPDGKQVLTGGYYLTYATITLWDTATGDAILTFSGHKGDMSIPSVTFSPDGKQMLSGSYDKTVKLWDVATGRELRTFSGHTEGIDSVKFSPDGRQVLSGSIDKAVKLWDAATGRELRTFSGHTGFVTSVAFSPDGRQALSGSNDRTVKLWDAATGRVIRTFSGHTDYINSVAFDPGNKQIISGSRDNTVKLWDVATGREIRAFSRPTSYVYSVAFSPDGRQVLSGSGDNTAKLWDEATGSLIRTFSGHTDDVRSVAFSPDGRQVLSGSDDKTVKLWDAATGRELRTFSRHTGSVYSVTFSPDGKQIISGSADKTINLWDAATGRKVLTFSGLKYSVSSLMFSPDGRQLLSGSNDQNDNTVKLWDTATGRVIRTFLASDLGPNSYSVAFSPDGRQALSGSADKTMKLWDMGTGRLIRTFSGHTSSVFSVAFSPDGRQVLSGSSDNTAKLWDVATGRELRTFEHMGPVFSVKFSPDGGQIVSASTDGTVRLWDVSGKEIAQFISFTDSEWLVITPEGWYNASPYGDKYLNVRVGNNVYGIDQYRAVFYKPQIVEAKLSGNSGIVVPQVRIDDAAKFAAPRITIKNPEDGTQYSVAQANVSVTVEDQNQPIKEVKVVVNGRLVGGDELSQLTGTRGIKTTTQKIEIPANQRRVEFTLPVVLEPGRNNIEVIAFNGYGEAVEAVEVFYRSSQANLPNLWILAVGINKYDSPDLKNLNYAVNDARELVAAFKAQEGKRFNKVNSLLITDETPVKPTAANIIDSMDFLSRAGQHDYVLLFMAGHGITDTRNTFFFCSSDAVFSNGTIQRSSAVPSSEIMRIQELPCKKLIFLDACYSESAGGTRGVDNNRLIRELMEPSTFVFTSSTGQQLSQESSKERHGVFTYALLQGMKGAADYDKDGYVSMKELDAYVSRLVPEMTNGAQHPVSTVKGGNNVDFTISAAR